MRISVPYGGRVGLLVLSLPAVSEAALEGLQRVSTGLAAPMFVTHAPGDTTRLFIAQRGGQIRIFDTTTGTLQATPFLSTTVDASGEGGLLGLAFHPNYFKEGMPGFGKFYVDVTTGGPFTIRVREFQVNPTNPNLANAGSLREIINVPHEFATNHNGGWIDFSPNDNYLYIGTGDGGGGNDDGTGHTPGTGNAQDTTNNLLGKMLRIDVNGDDFPGDAARNYAIPPTNPFKAGVGVPGDDVGDDEIWAYGLRNPFRAGFDRQTGDLWIGDVGQGQREEIDFQAGNSTGAANYGWRLREGLIQTPTVGGPKPADNVDPVYDYNRNADQFGGTVVSGGYVYRGPDPALQGKYFFLDSRNTAGTTDDNYWHFDPANPFGTVANIDALLTPDVGAPQFPVSFGEDEYGNLYIAYLITGDVYRIKTTAAPVIAAGWNVNSAGNWSLGSNWSGGSAPNNVGHTATFGSAILADRTITVDAPKTVGTITFDNAAASYTIAGAGPLIMDASSGGSAINVISGSHTISAPVLISDSVAINVPASSLITLSGGLTGINVTAVSKTGAGNADVKFVRAGTLTVSAGTMRVLPDATAAGASRVTTVAVSPGAKLDLTDNKMVTFNAPGSATGGVYNGLQGLVQSGRNGGMWNGSGIMTSQADALTNLTTLGVATGAQIRGLAPTATDLWAGRVITGDSTLVMYTYAGDLNLDGEIDADDYASIDFRFSTPGANGYYNGDINYDGSINADDYALIDFNNNAQGAPFPTSSGVQMIPEPTGFAVIAVSAVTWARRRRRVEIRRAGA